MKTKLVAAAIGVCMTIASGGIAHAIGSGERGPFSGPSGDQDASAYWVDISNIGAAGTIADASKLGHSICTRLEGGMTEGHAIAILATPPDPIPMSAATIVVHAAEWHFCPDQY